AGVVGTSESAMQARERLTAEGKGGERIVIIDSRTGCGGVGLMILAAARAAQQGARAGGAGGGGAGGERIVIIDSRTGCGGMGLMILAAARAAKQGASAGEARDRALVVRSELRIWFAVDTLDYLRRGGRIGAARAWIGTTLKIKPILTLEEEITPGERVRTHR